MPHLVAIGRNPSGTIGVRNYNGPQKVGRTESPRLVPPGRGLFFYAGPIAQPGLGPNIITAIPTKQIATPR